MRRLAGKVALVTGASRGLGRAIALRLADEGAAVAVHYHAARDGAQQTAAAVRERNGGTVHVVQADGTRQADVRRAVAEVVTTLGGIDVLVNNAGQHRRASSLEQAQADWDDLIGRNLSATYFFAQAPPST